MELSHFSKSLFCLSGTCEHCSTHQNQVGTHIKLKNKNSMEKVDVSIYNCLNGLTTEMPCYDNQDKCETMYIVSIT